MQNLACKYHVKLSMNQTNFYNIKAEELEGGKYNNLKYHCFIALLNVIVSNIRLQDI